MAARNMPVVISTGLRAAGTREALRLLSGMLAGAGFVDERYGDAVIDREDGFPTGLPTDPPVALPHADPDHVRQSAIAVGIFDKPVVFKEMGNPDRVLNVRLVFLLALKGKEEAAGLLRELVLAFRDHEGLARLQEAGTEIDAREVLGDLLHRETASQG